MLVIGILRVELRLPGACSLKDKRSVIKSILERSRNRFSVSSAEIEKQDNIREAVLAFTYVGNAAPFVESVMHKVEDFVASFPECEIVDSESWCDCQ